MRRILLLGPVISVLLVLILFPAACQVPRGTNQGSANSSALNYKIVVIDSCEYIEVYEGIGQSSVYSLTHKGNCKNPIHKLDKSEKSVTIIP